jgi:hypothetical protein
MKLGKADKSGDSDKLFRYNQLNGYAAGIAKASTVVSANLNSSQGSKNGMRRKTWTKPKGIVMPCWVLEQLETLMVLGLV